MKNYLDKCKKSSIINNVAPIGVAMREWRNWQTRTFEGRVVTPYGFKSRFSHQNKRGWQKPSSFVLARTSRHRTPQMRQHLIVLHSLYFRSKFNIGAKLGFVSPVSQPGSLGGQISGEVLCNRSFITRR